MKNMSIIISSYLKVSADCIYLIFELAISGTGVSAFLFRFEMCTYPSLQSGAFIFNWHGLSETSQNSLYFDIGCDILNINMISSGDIIFLYIMPH